MPTIFRDGPYRFYFFSHEPNEPVTFAKGQGFRGHEIMPYSPMWN